MWTAILSIAGPIILWILKQAGAKEEALIRVREAISSVQKNRTEATTPMDDEARARERLRRENPPGGPPII